MRARENLILDPDGHTRCRICTKASWAANQARQLAKKKAAVDG